jgi:hypothetical protein
MGGLAASIITIQFDAPPLAAGWVLPSKGFMHVEK